MSAFRGQNAFRRLGLATNPFNQRDHSELARLFPAPDWLVELADGTWDGVMIHGPSGVGKTTAAHMLKTLLEDRGCASIHWVRLTDDGSRWPDAPAGVDLLVVDSVQRLARLAKWRLGVSLKRSPRTILVGQEEVTAGRVPAGYVLFTVVPPPPTLAEARLLVATYVNKAVIAGSEVERLLPSDARLEQLLDLAGGNRLRLHRVCYQCFELWADGRGTWPDDDLLAPRAARVVDDEEAGEDC